MTSETTARPTLTLPSELAVEAAGVFDRFLASLTKSGPIEEASADTWQALEANGWPSAGQELADERLDILDLTELATAWGRHLIPGPFITTLIARRHVKAEAPSAFGSTYALVDGPGALVPFGALPGCTFLSALGPDGGTVGEIEASEVDDFAATLPLAIAAKGSKVDAQIVRETVVLYLAELIGMAEAVLDKTLTFTAERKAYGQEIAKFQVIRFRMADVLADIETMRGLLLVAAHDPEPPARATRLAARITRRIVEACLQTHGAMGFTWELGLHRPMRHAMAVDKLMLQVLRAAA